MALEGQTPASKAGIKFKAQNNWLDMLYNTKNLKLS
jgi:hypothetical protein